MKHTHIKLTTLMIFSGTLAAVETTVQNDSLVDFSQGAIQAGFVANESASVWLDSPCDGNLIAVQIFWRSLTGGFADSIEDSINISDAGTFPLPGSSLENIFGPVLKDGVFNEYRYLDENNVIPLVVPVQEDETYVITFTFANTPISGGPSLLTDVDGCQFNKNAIFAIPPSTWFDSCLLGVSGDFVMRAVIDCPADPLTVDLMVEQSTAVSAYTPGQDIDYQIIVSNNGPSTSNLATLIDFFPTDISSIDWMCTGQGGATCTNATGTGNLLESINLPASSSLTFEVVGSVDINTVGVLTNTAQVVVPAGLTDTNPGNNTHEINLISIDDLIFADQFE